MPHCLFFKLRINILRLCLSLINVLLFYGMAILNLDVAIVIGFAAFIRATTQLIIWGMTLCFLYSAEKQNTNIEIETKILLILICGMKKSKGMCNEICIIVFSI